MFAIITKFKAWPRPLAGLIQTPTFRLLSNTVNKRNILRAATGKVKKENDNFLEEYMKLKIHVEEEKLSGDKIEENIEKISKQSKNLEQKKPEDFKVVNLKRRQTNDNENSDESDQEAIESAPLENKEQQSLLDNLIPEELLHQSIYKCKGCGVVLQTESDNKLGYIPQEKFENFLKSEKKRLRKELSLTPVENEEYIEDKKRELEKVEISSENLGTEKGEENEVLDNMESLENAMIMSELESKIEEIKQKINEKEMKKKERLAHRSKVNYETYGHSKGHSKENFALEILDLDTLQQLEQLNVNSEHNHAHSEHKDKSMICMRCHQLKFNSKLLKTLEKKNEERKATSYVLENVSADKIVRQIFRNIRKRSIIIKVIVLRF